MRLLDRLRPRWRHPDPEVRAAAVRELGHGEQRTLATVARQDPEPRVRRIALKRLEDAELLLALAASEAEESLRQLAAERAQEVLMAIAASSERPEVCEGALARLTDAPSLTRVAQTAAHASVRHAALARLSGDRVLRDVVKGAGDPTIRRQALARIEDAATLRSVALSDVPPEIALEAVERIDDPHVLASIAQNRTVSKSVRQRAQARAAALAGDDHPVRLKECRARQLQLCIAVEALGGVEDAAARLGEAEREWEDLARRVEPRDDVRERFARARAAALAESAGRERRRAEAERARSAVEEGLARRGAVCALVESLGGADAPRRLAEARAAWAQLAPLPDEQAAPLAARFARAGAECEARHERWLARAALRGKLEGLVAEAEGLARGAGAGAAERWTALEERWAALDPRHDSSDELLVLRHRLATAGEALRRRRAEDDAARSQRQQDNLAHLRRLQAQITELVGAETLRLGDASRELRAVRAVLKDLGPLPPGESRAAWKESLAAAHDALFRRFGQQQETEEWRRWANVGAQEELIGRLETLLSSTNLADATRELGRIQDDWKRVAAAPREQAAALWERFRTARDALRARCDAFLASNLEKKRDLCERVRALGDSTEWSTAAAEIKRLQAEWKTIGPVPANHAEVLFRRFREPCDRFFARRKEHFERADHERSENAKRKEALCAQAEALAESTDWEATAKVLKQLQGAWREIGPAPRGEADALWERFRGACDRFFARRSRRGELELEDRLGKAAAVCADLEALVSALGSAEAPAADAVGPRVERAWAEWRRLDLLLVEEARPLGERLRAACERIALLAPESLRGTGLDPEVTRKRREKLCARVEELASSRARPVRAPSLEDLASRLRDALAANTIGGSADPDAKGRADALQEVDRLWASWVRLGPVLDDHGRALEERFEKARARLASASAEEGAAGAATAEGTRPE